jgi:hypothetical protein
VSPTGSDADPGTLDRPFATFEHARAAVREVIAAGIPPQGIAVFLRGGVYERSATLELGPADSGKTDAPIVWRGYPGEPSRILGGRRLDPGWFAPVTSASPVWSRVDPAAQGHLVQIDLEAHGISDYGTLAVRGFSSGGNAALELFIDGRAMTLARWPDDSVTDPKSSFVTTAAPVTATTFAYAGDRPARWPSGAVWLHGFWGNAWADQHLPAAKIDTAQRTITLGQAPTYTLQADRPFYAYNLLEEITAPGEWYLDRATGILYLYPPHDLAGADIVVSMLAGPLVRLSSGASYITLRDTTLEATRAELIDVRGGAHDVLEGLTLRNAGTDGASLDGTQLLVKHAHVYGIGEQGIAIGGGDRLTLVGAGDAVEGSYIHDFARWSWTYNPAIRVSGVGNAVRNNLLSDAPHAAILFSGNDHVIELNEVHHVCRSTSDSGAVYAGRDWSYRGNVIRHNFFHDISTWQPGSGVHAVYLDDTLAGIRVEGNVFYGVSGTALKHGGGRDDVFVNNVIAHSGRAFATDARGSTGNAKYNLLDRLEAVGYQKDPWKTRYPECAAIPDSWATLTAPGSLWLYPQGTVFSRNIGFKNTTFTSETSNATSYFTEMKDNVADMDPKFADESKLDLSLLPGSPALAIPGFVPIPFDKIGIRP